jgi:hypothetical protein
VRGSPFVSGQIVMRAVVETPPLRSPDPTLSPICPVGEGVGLLP